MHQFLSGWRPSKITPEDHARRFQAAPHILRALPASIDLSQPPPSQLFGQTWDQANEGACGPHSETENILFDEALSPAPDTVPSRQFLYYVTRQLMGTTSQDSGVDNKTMLQALQQFGWCDETLWPYDQSNMYTQPPQAAYDQAATRIKPIQFQLVPQDLQQMKACLVQNKRPFIFGFNVYRSMLSNAVAQTGNVPDPGGLLDTFQGGHDVLIVGYDDATQRFKFKNHWMNGPGQPWGNGGYGTISYKYATDPNLAGDFWVVTAVEGANPMPPTPTPTPPAPPDPIPPTPPAPAPVPKIWQRLIAIIEALLKRWGPLAVPIVEAWVATLPLPPAVIAIIDQLLQQYLGQQLAAAIAGCRSPADLLHPTFVFGE